MNHTLAILFSSDSPDDVKDKIKASMIELAALQPITLASFESAEFSPGALGNLEQPVMVLPSHNFFASILDGLPEDLESLGVTDAATLEAYAQKYRLLEIIKECYCLPPFIDDDDGIKINENSDVLVSTPVTE